MGLKLSAGEKVEPHQINNARDLYGRSFSENSDDFKSKKRTTTDVCFLLVITTFLLIFLGFLGYCISHGDIFRILNGYDNCGYVCAMKNALQNGDNRDEACADSSKVALPYHIIIRRNDSAIKERKCVSNCYDYEGYRRFFHRCILIKNGTIVNTFLSKTGIKNFFEEVSEDFDLCWKEFIYLCLLSLVFAVLILVSFRFLVGAVVWIVLVGVVLACSIGTVLLWIMWDQSRKSTRILPEDLISDVDTRKKDSYFVFAIIASVITIVVVLIIIVMRKRIQLVVQLFEEAGKAMAAMPLLLLQPLVTFIALVITIIFWFYFTLWIESSGHLTASRPHVYYFEKDDLMKVTRWYNLLAMLWMVQFVIGCQHMIVAGSVSEWYFARDKNNVDKPIFKSVYNLVRYHLGSVALGSFLIAVVQLIRILLKVVERYLNSHRGKCVDCALKCCQCCLYCFDNALKYLSRNAYIEIAMYGYSFCRGARQAFKILLGNVLRVAAINSVGDFVLLLGKVLVVIATVLVGIKILQNKEGVQHIWVPVTLAGLFAYFVAHCFITIYEMAIDTIFLCFCEDCEENDGTTKPYFMSKGLMEFVENSKRALKVYEDKNRQGQAWQHDLPSISGSINK